MRRLPALVLTALLPALLACPPPGPGTDYYPSSSAVCGNERKQSGEDCDGTDLNDKTCEDLGFGPGLLSCKPDCDDFDRAGCAAPEGCGNGTIEGVEICDGADLDGKNCEDLGLGAGFLSCLSNCGDFDISLCSPPPDCGDNDKNGSAELCDGDDFGGLTCERMGFTGGDLVCAGDCLSIDRSGCVDECVPSCGGRECGPDPSCGVSCGICDAGACVNGTCQAGGDGGGPSCPADKDCTDRQCGPDPVCGLSCGSCSSGSCNTTGQCVGSTSCTQGSTRCSTDSYGFEACGLNLSSSAVEYGPRVPCGAGQSCNAGSCNRSGCLQTEFIMLLDRSSSMLSGDTWTWVREITEGALYHYDNSNAIGFKAFPGSSGCTAGSLTPMALDNADNIYVSDPTTNASTPIEDALSNLVSAYGDPNDGQAVILVSDGDETCGSATGAVEQASALFRAGIPVHTVAVTTTANRTLLDQIAQVGGTGSAHLVTTAQQLADAYEAIMAELGACADCDPDQLPSCVGDTLRFCNGDEMVEYDCSSDVNSSCGYYSSSIGDRCLGGEAAQCDPDVQHYVQVCDPSGGVFCNSGGVCELSSVDAGVSPDGGGGSAVEGELRLVDGDVYTTGRLVVFHDDQWGTVCDDSWTQAASDVACRQMFGADYTGTEGDATGGYDPIWLDEVICDGTETQLMDCSHNAWGTNDCGHDEDVHLTCTN